MVPCTAEEYVAAQFRCDGGALGTLSITGVMTGQGGGATYFNGTKGSAKLSGNSFVLYNAKGKVVLERKDGRLPEDLRKAAGNHGGAPALGTFNIALQIKEYLEGGNKRALDDACSFADTLYNQKVIEAILPSKDVDGFHPMNVGNLSSGYESSIPCTPLGCYLLIKKIEPNLSGKKAVIIGRSNLNGKPMTQLLLKENCTVTITHSKTKDLKGECLKGDIIVAAVGMPELVKGDWVKKDAIVIDVGINKTDKGIVGDVAFDEVSKVAKALTPVPGGVGPMTIACLLKNTIECFKRSN